MALYNFGRRFIYLYIVFVNSAVVIVIIIIPTMQSGKQPNSGSKPWGTRQSTFSST